MSNSDTRDNSSELNQLSYFIFRICAWLLVLWILFLCIHTALPYIRPGDTLVFNEKVITPQKNFSFPENATCRFLIFGDSKILAGFIPSIFDSNVPGNISSINCGLPNTQMFLSLLKKYINNGTIPTHILLTAPLDTLTEKMNKPLSEHLFPFRKLPRNLILFLMRSISRNGPVSYYQFGKQSIHNMIKNRGYFFIEGQSHYPDHQLPDIFSAPSDSPEMVLQRNIVTYGPIFQELKKLQDKYGISVIFIPAYYRIGEYAPSVPSHEKVTSTQTADKHFVFLGPDYFLFHNKYFSDKNHLNQQGAGEYTVALSNLFTSFLAESGSNMNVNNSIPGRKQTGAF